MTKRILVVDDESHVRTLLEHTLDPFEDLDVQLLLAASADEALEACREHLPDLAFVDATMPAVNGYDLCDRLRATEGGGDIHIVLLLDKGQPPDTERCSGVGFADVVTKPFDPDQIRLMTGRLLGINVEL
jgi:CheY-like chemotaxis protein